MTPEREVLNAIYILWLRELGFCLSLSPFSVSLALVFFWLWRRPVHAYWPSGFMEYPEDDAWRQCMWTCPSNMNRAPKWVDTAIPGRGLVPKVPAASLKLHTSSRAHLPHHPSSRSPTIQTAGQMEQGCVSVAGVLAQHTWSSGVDFSRTL